MREYSALTQPIAQVPTAEPGAGAFAALQQRVARGAALPTAPQAAGATEDEFAAAQAKAQQAAAEAEQAQIQALESAMSGQSSQLISSWQPSEMRQWAGAAASPATVGLKSKEAGGEAGTATGEAAATGAPLIKAGSILFAVLDTAVNSDYPDSPVMATIVLGPFKGAKLLGKLTTAKGVAGQMDRVSLAFSMMNMEIWPKEKTISAYAIDPDTARVVLASSVNYHYAMRYGAYMATSFLQGYATAITNAGTATTGIFGTSTTHPNLSPGNKVAVAFGQMGQNLSSVTQNYTNIPPTVKVDSGVGLGILFMADVT